MRLVTTLVLIAAASASGLLGDATAQVHGGQGIPTTYQLRRRPHATPPVFLFRELLYGRGKRARSDELQYHTGTSAA